MKKKIKFLICAAIVFSCTAVCKAQQEAAMLVDGMVWVYSLPNSIIYGADEFEATYVMVFVDGDTIINEKQYKKISAEQVREDMTSMGIKNLVAIREEGNRIYAARELYAQTFFKDERTTFVPFHNSFEQDEDEYIVYDFDALKNDSEVILYYADGKQIPRSIVDKTSSVTMEDGTIRTLYKVFNRKEQMIKLLPANTEIIDRIGCRNMPGCLFHYFSEPSVISPSLKVYTYLNFVVRDGKIIYKDAEEYVPVPWQDYIAGYASGIVQPEKARTSTGIFNLQGQRISHAQKGLNIIDGRKVWVR